MVPSEEYVKALDKAISDLEDHVKTRDLLNAEIAGLRETVRVLSSLAGILPDKQRHVAKLLALVDYATPSLTDAIRSLAIHSYPKELTAIDVRNALEDSGFDFGDFSNSLSACHSALKRLEADGVIEKAAPRDGKTTYRGVLKISRPAGTFLDVVLAGIIATPSPSVPPNFPSTPRKTIGQRIAEPSSKLTVPHELLPPNREKK